MAGGREIKVVEDDGTALKIDTAIELYTIHIKTHSPDKPRTLERYREVLTHFERHLGKKKYVEAITRSDIDDYKNSRSHETVKDGERKISPATINFEVNTLRSFFYYLIRERGIKMENPCARFKMLRAAKEKLNRRPPTYSQDELNRLFSACDRINRAIYTTLLLTGLRKDELNHLAWDDINFENGEIRVQAKDDFCPKDYEERLIPITDELIDILENLPRTSEWVFPTSNGNRMGRNEVLRRLKRIAKRAIVEDATVHKFRHYAESRTMPSKSLINCQNATP